MSSPTLDLTNSSRKRKADANLSTNLNTIKAYKCNKRI